MGTGTGTGTAAVFGTAKEGEHAHSAAAAAATPTKSGPHGGIKDDHVHYTTTTTTTTTSTTQSQHGNNSARDQHRKVDSNKNNNLEAMTGSGVKSNNNTRLSPSSPGYNSPPSGTSDTRDSGKKRTLAKKILDSLLVKSPFKLSRQDGK